jgi:hypothetical protein
VERMCSLSNRTEERVCGSDMGQVRERTRAAAETELTATSRSDDAD